MALQRFRLQETYVLQKIFIDELLESTRHSGHSYWWSKKNATIHDLARQATTVTKLQHGSHKLHTSRLSYKTDNQHNSTWRRGCKVTRISSNSLLSIKSSRKNAFSSQSLSTDRNVDLGTSRATHRAIFFALIVKEDNQRYVSLPVVFGKQPPNQAISVHPASAPRRPYRNEQTPLHSGDSPYGTF